MSSSAHVPHFASLVIVLSTCAAGCSKKQSASSSEQACAAAVADTREWLWRVADNNFDPPWPTGNAATDRAIDDIVRDFHERVETIRAKDLAQPTEDKIAPLLVRCPAAKDLYERSPRGLATGEGPRDAIGRLQGVVDAFTACKCDVDIGLFKARTYIAFAAASGYLLDNKLRGPSEMKAK
jgi:hypothetical protein